MSSPGRDLQLEAAVALFDERGRGRDERRGALGAPDRDAGVDVGSPAAEVGRERRALGAQPRVEERVAERGAGRVVAPDLVEVAAPEQPRDELVAQDQASGVERLGRVGGGDLGADFAPALGVVGDHAHEQRVLVHRRAARGAKRRDQRQPDPEQLDGAYANGHGAGAYARVGPGTRPGPT